MRNQVSATLERNTRDKMLFGVASGLGDYFGLDTVLVRVGFVVTAILTGGVMVVAYLLLAVLVPERNGAGPTATSDAVGEAGAAESAAGEDHASHSAPDTGHRTLVARRQSLAGWILIVFGAIILAVNLGAFDWIRFRFLWPLALIVLGGALIFATFRRADSRD